MPSLLEALENKYSIKTNDETPTTAAVAAAAAATDATNDTISIYIPRLSPLICVPELLVLNDYDIDCAGDFLDSSIRDKCVRVRELDLAQNKLHDWYEVLQIIQHMPRIEFLNLSRNHLSGSLTENYIPPITNLRGIVLNETYLNWNSICILLDNLPILEELHLSLNDYNEILIDSMEESTDANDDDDDRSSCNNEMYSPTMDNGRYRNISSHKSLKILHFTGNPVEHWPEICRLGRVFPQLEKLVLAKCPIKAIECSNNTIHNSTTVTTASCLNLDNDRTNAHIYFPNLLYLNLSCARIHTWDAIDRLAKFPKLTNLRAKGWPLWDNLQCTEHERRQLLIARLPNITILNGGGVISNVEREDAERAFIRYYMVKGEDERPQRYNELVQKHGKLDPLVNISLKPNKYVKVLFTYQNRTELHLIDVYRTVSDLKGKLEKIFFDIPANKMRLYYLDKDYKEFGPEEMRYPNKLLYSYNISEGDEIIIDSKKTNNNNTNTSSTSP